MCNCQRSVIHCLRNYPFLNMTKMCCFGFSRPGPLKYSCSFYKSDRLYNIANHISENKVLNMENLRFYFSKPGYHETKPEVLYPQLDPDLETDTLLNATGQEATRMSADPISWSSLSVEVNRARSCCLAQKQCVTSDQLHLPPHREGQAEIHSVSANELNLLLGQCSAAAEGVAQRSCGCPIPGIVQGQCGWSFEEAGFMEGISSHGGGVGIGWSLTTLPIQTIQYHTWNGKFAHTSAVQDIILKPTDIIPLWGRVTDAKHGLPLLEILHQVQNSVQRVRRY